MLVITGQPLLLKKQSLGADQVTISIILLTSSIINQIVLLTPKNIQKRQRWKRDILFTVDQKKCGSWGVIKIGKNIKREKQKDKERYANLTNKQLEAKRLSNREYRRRKV